MKGATTKGNAAPEGQPSSNGKPAAKSPATKSPETKIPAEKSKATGDKPAAPQVLSTADVFEPLPLSPGPGPAAKGWGNYFEKNPASSAAIRDLVTRLHSKKDYAASTTVMEAAIRTGRGHPWMYEVLPYEMVLAERPGEDIERVLLSSLDLGIANTSNLLLCGAYLAKFERYERALKLYEVAARIEPNSPEPYVLALGVARKINSSTSIKWAACGIVQHVWTRDFDSYHRTAVEAVSELEARLRAAGDTGDADRLVADFAKSRQRDLMIELTWSGTADLDLTIEEPAGTVCSFDVPRTAGGGWLVRDGYGPLSENTRELYVCPQAMSGDYRVVVNKIRGDAVGGRALLKVSKYVGTERETNEVLPVQVSATARAFRIKLQSGRLQQLIQVPAPPEAKRGAAADNSRVDNSRLDKERAAWKKMQFFAKNGKEDRKASRGLTDLRRRNRVRQAGGVGFGGAVGYNPIIRVFTEGVTLNTSAVVSADRRYVRLGLNPTFTAITDVFTFTFANGAGIGAGGGGAGLGGGAGGGAGGGGGGLGGGLQ